MNSRLLALGLSIITILSSTSSISSFAATKESPVINTDVISVDSVENGQISALSMMNYLMVLTKEINDSKESRLYLDSVHSSMVNNLNLNAISPTTADEINKLFDTIGEYQMIADKREALQFLNEQVQGTELMNNIQAPLNRIPDLAVSYSDKNYVALVANVMYLTGDVVNIYLNYSASDDFNSLNEGYQLSSKEKKILTDSSNNAFNYLVRMCNENNIDSKMALREDNVKAFVEWENDENVSSRIKFLRDNQETYQAYGKYWLVYAKSFYEAEQYQECLDIIDFYLGLNFDTFEKDYDLAQLLPVVIESAGYIYDGDEYVKKATQYIDLILSNIDKTKTDSWSLRYFVTQAYIDLYAKTGDSAYLEEAYEQITNTVNILAKEQKNLNETYLAKLETIKNEYKLTDPKHKETDQYNRWLKESRKTALPPVYEPLVVCMDLLNKIVEEMNISETEMGELEETIYGGKCLFLAKQLDDYYHFAPYKSVDTKPECEFSGSEVSIPVTYLPADADLHVTVDGKDVFDDWTISEVSRSAKDGIDTWTASFKSKQIKDVKWTPDSKVKLEILPSDNSGYPVTTVNFEAKKAVHDKVADIVLKVSDVVITFEQVD